MVVDGSPGEVRERLDRALIRVGSVWFPSPAELHRWSRTTTPLYVRWLGEAGFELGPRTEVMRTATLCPVVRGRLTAEGPRTRLEGVFTFTPFTWALLGFWLALEVVWGAIGLPAVLSGEVHASWLVWWGLPLVGLLLAAGLGWVRGKAALEGALGDLRRIAGSPPVDEDW
jgi:hypothetical protein